MSLTSISSLISLFKAGLSADDLLKSKEIIKNMIIGISCLDNENPNSLARIIFGDVVSHASLFLSMGDKKNSKTGVLVQYGKYEYIKNKKEVIGKNLDSLGYVYKEKGGLNFGEIDYNLFKKDFCSICYIKPKIDKQITLSKLIEEVTKNKVWDLASYSVLYHNCQHFVAESIRVLNPKYNPELIEIVDNSKIQGKDDEAAIPPVILEQLKKNYININYG
jgi:excinuclease UvrABC nuclease subunit